MSITALRERMSAPTTYACRPGHSGHGMGNKAEELADVPENNRDEADHPELGEIKTKIEGIDTLLTLFTRNPRHNLMDTERPGRKRGAIRALTETYGLLVEDEAKADRRNLYQSVKFGKPTRVGDHSFELALDEPEGAKPRLTLCVNGVPCSAWDTEVLDTAFQKKLPKLTIPKGKTELLDETHPDYAVLSETGQARLATWSSITTYEEPSLNGFWQAVREGKVVVDLRAYIYSAAGKIKSRDHGTAFRIAEANISMIFTKSSITVV